jgi:hypothetical protein
MCRKREEQFTNKREIWAFHNSGVWHGVMVW